MGFLSILPDSLVFGLCVSPGNVVKFAKENTGYKCVCVCVYKTIFSGY